MVIALLAERCGSRFKAHRSGSDVAEGRLAGVPVTLARPRSYMNLSGKPVAALTAFYKVPPDRLVVVHDELDLPTGRVKVKEGGGLAGHNGLRSIKSHLHTDAFVRVRIGVGKPPSKEQGANHVLRRPGKKEQAELDIAVVEAADAVEMIVRDGVAAAMNVVNARPAPAEG